MEEARQYSAVRPFLTSIEEDLPHPVKNGRARLVARASGWHVSFTLFGPDLRYNALYLSFHPEGSSDLAAGGMGAMSLESFRIASERASKKYEYLKQDSELPGKTLAIAEECNLTIHLNGPLGSGVYLAGHLMFCNSAEQASFLAAIDWAFERGPLLVQKCADLDKL